MYSVPGPCFTQPGGSCHRTADYVGNLLTPHHPCTHKHTRTHTLHQPQTGGLGRVKSISHSFIRLRASVWPGWLITLPRGGRHMLAAFRSLTIPSSHLHMDTHKHWDTHGQIFRPHQHHQHRHRHLTGPWVEDMWPGEMRHNAGLSLWQICLSACLKITSLERLTETDKKEFCFPLWLQHSPSALRSPQLLDTVALDTGIAQFSYS